jgi:hypothetical protein
MWLGTRGPLLVSSPTALCDVGGRHGELRLGLRPWPLMAVGYATPRRAVIRSGPSAAFGSAVRRRVVAQVDCRPRLGLGLPSLARM